MIVRPSTAPNDVTQRLTWTGYVTHPSASRAFQYSWMRWYVPYPGADTSGVHRTVAVWPGIGSGGDRDHALVQAGTVTDTGRTVPNGVATWFWFEVAPQYALTKITLPAHRGDDVGVDVEAIAGGSRTSPEVAGVFTFHNYTTGGSCQLTSSYVSGAPGVEGEAIAERVTLGKTATPLAKYRTFGVTQTNMRLSGGSTSQCIAYWNETRVDMYDSSGEIAYSRFETPDGCSWRSWTTKNT